MLEQILAHKREEVTRLKAQTSLPENMQQFTTSPPPSLRSALGRQGPAIIAEIKYASPSQGRFEIDLSPESIAKGYAKAGVAAISVLTDQRFFDGSLANLQSVAESVDLPTLRKDFIIDPFQVYQARSAGAAGLLLMVACLEQKELEDLIALTRDLQMTPLVEVRDRQEADRALAAGASTIGINNRDLDDLSVDLERGRRLVKHFHDQEGLVLVCESGISNRYQIDELHDHGFDAFLIGTSLMHTPDPGAALARILGGSDD